ncbi:glycosyltransferase family 2 protein [Caproiciproducens sp. NJN-50]|uniref:glycosyltransferase n=1 Tax=Acutalibacteraceae TaxID=3082771 RepID=UPI000FFE2067|nr:MULTISPECIES: glycosyltransferase family 2 protein [Acutalibacteraceae]QAT50705.1 glycosyltransferase family 2 protein [Caproiciproducens sp. NJN-50]
MKARVRQENVSKEHIIRISGEGPYHGHPIRLTIGMIVKNEEKTLDRCLSSLKPLMEAVESELIITDTGSTDRTVKIAEKYTDHIIHFQWCDDFSAARNTGLKAARGEWFMFLDGDEWFEDTNELIDFFTSGECDRYGSASYIQRNYNNFDGKRYNDFHAMRVYRVYQGIRFVNVIHENIPAVKPIKFVNDYVHHYGYIFHCEAEKRKKRSRNTTLLELEIKDHPKNLKAYLQSAMQFLSEDPARAEQYCNFGLQIERENPDPHWRLSLLHILATAYMKENKSDKLFRLLENDVPHNAETEVLWIDFHGCAQSAAFSVGDYERSIDHGKAYLKLYEKNRLGQLNQYCTLFSALQLFSPLSRERALCILGESFLSLNRISEARHILDSLEISFEELLAPEVKFLYGFGGKTGDWTCVSGFYRKACGAGEEIRDSLRRTMESQLPEDLDKRTFATREISAMTDDDDAYVRINRLRDAERSGNRNAAQRELSWFFQWDGDWDATLYDVLFYGMKEQADITPLLRKIGAEDLKGCAVNMQTQHLDFLEVIKNYRGPDSGKSMQRAFWLLCLKEQVILTQGLGDEEVIALFWEYASQSAQYLRMLYRPELLSPESVSALPREHRFWYYINLALSARGQGNDVAYIANLRHALHGYPVMKKPISLLLEQFQQKEKERKEKAEEFRTLAGRVKENIKALIAQGKLEEAGRYTAQLARLLPDDPDVVRFRTLTHTEPDMNELAAHLPQ